MTNILNFKKKLHGGERRCTRPPTTSSKNLLLNKILYLILKIILTDYRLITFIIKSNFVKQFTILNYCKKLYLYSSICINFLNYYFHILKLITYNYILIYLFDFISSMIIINIVNIVYGIHFFFFYIFILVLKLITYYSIIVYLTDIFEHEYYDRY